MEKIKDMSTCESFIVSGIIKRRKEKEEKIRLEKLKQISNLMQIGLNPELSLGVEKRIDLFIQIHTILLYDFDILFLNKEKQKSMFTFLKKVIHKKTELREELALQIIKNPKITSICKKLNILMDKVYKKSLHFVMKHILISGDSLLENPTTCPICLEEIEKERISTCCGHGFHQKCMFQHIMTDNHTCPMCRETIVQFNLL